MPNYIIRLLAAVFLAVMKIAAIQPAFADSPKWGAHLDFEGRWSSTRSLGDMGLFAPLWQDATTLLFTDFRGKFDDVGGREGNFGLGVRRMLPNGWNVGAYGYYDARQTRSGNFFHQVTLGAEALSADFDLRGNVYLPVGRTSRETGTVTSGPVFLEFANEMLQLVHPALNWQIERAMSGFDAEIGWRAPVFDVDSLSQLRLYAGGYHFSGGGVVPNVSGPRGRLEFSIDDVGGWGGSRLTFGAEVQHDDVRGTQGIGVARLRIPLQQGRSYASLTEQERRMTERVVRDVDIVTGRGVGSVIRAQQREDVVNSWNGQRVTRVKQVTASDENALNTALVSVGAGGIVILNGAIAGAGTSTIVDANQTLIGGGTPLAVSGVVTGTAATFVAPGSAGSISGAIGGGLEGIVQASSGSVVGGLAISNSANVSSGILFNSAVGGVAFSNRVQTGGASSPAIFTLDSSGTRIIGNVAETQGGLSHAVFVLSSSGAVVDGNRLATAGSNSLGVGINSSPDAIVTNNQVRTTNATGAYAIGVQTAQSTNALISGNTVTSVSSAIFFAYGATARFVNNNISGNSSAFEIFGNAGFLSGSTGNVTDIADANRCSTAGAVTVTGTVQFTSGVSCP